MHAKDARSVNFLGKIVPIEDIASKKIHVVCAGSQVLLYPWQVGGLGDVVTSLSRAVQDMNHTVNIILPKYDCLKTDHVSSIADSFPRVFSKKK